jgi:hypothetical protein
VTSEGNEDGNLFMRGSENVKKCRTRELIIISALKLAQISLIREIFPNMFIAAEVLPSTFDTVASADKSF